MRNPPHVALGTPVLLSEKEKASLNAAWDKKTTELMGRYRDDLLICEAIKEIRDGYFQLFAEKRFLLAQQRNDPENTTLQSKIADVDYDLVVHNNESFKRLTHPGYEISVKTQKTLFNGNYRPTHSGNPLTLLQAKKVIGAIIGISIDCFEDGLNRSYRRNKTPRMTVPGETSLLANPKSLNIHRDQPRKAWVDFVQNEAVWKR
jgi:hypothetical protein